MKKRIDVVIAIVFRDGRVLVCQRRHDDPLGGYWEFPGGKCEPGESNEQCLARELREELDIEVRPIEPLPPFEHDYPHVHVRLHPYLCEHVAGHPRPLAADRIEWLSLSDLAAYPFLPANGDLIRTLARSLPPAP